SLNLKPTVPSSYITQFCNRLALDKNVVTEAEEIVRKASEMGLTSGKGPTGVAAAAIYIASTTLNQQKTQKEIADVAGVTEVTIRNRYKEISRSLNIDLDIKII
ncbi:MAG: transcription initiation factor IIB, partial [Thermoplasmata archaeon]